MNTKLPQLLLACFLLVLVACNHEKYQPGTEVVCTLKYVSVRYVDDVDSPYVAVRDEHGLDYTDHGTSRKSARQLFDEFYSSAFNTNGVVTFKVRPDGAREILKACSSCDALDTK